MIITIKKSYIRLAVSLGLFILILFVAFSANPNLTGNVISDSTRDSGYDSVKVGETGVLYIEGLPEVILTVTLEDLMGFMESAKEGNSEVLEKMVEDKKIFWIPGGTVAGVLRSDSGIMEVEILKGDFEGKTGWIISDWIVNL